ncbi:MULTISPECIES: M56 family metallopeptidase [Tenacibaculum]|uniref:M56 family metallopeptidase n=1 Tax=Tenacibaculum TaxID=104267 RepID=UPI001F0AD2E9|nr:MULTISPECIES: M56 family metallopeptidase [Tenacibaculum]MCH3880862.1 M56 family metallopeptidase [Tenacibaculum aquimarinum]MDO6599539.1 M56 family metallopeptidase [Tenacibaculum sp. 1_MG-2023]
MVTYLIKSTLCLTLFLAFYHLVLEREKMHRFNRYYLLSSVLISFLAPLYTIYIKVIQEPMDEFTLLTDNTVFTEEIIPIEEPVNYWNYVIYFSIVVSTILLIRFIKNLYSIYRKVSISEKFTYKSSTIVLVADNILPHTFWNYIFINKQEYETQKIEQELFTHELTHVAQKHTFDVLLIELLKVVFWFNPIFYFLKKSVQLNHEFLADTNVVSLHKNVSKYQHLLINTSAWSNEYALASNLHYLVTKKRIVMMTKQTSKSVIRLKKIAVLPLLIGAIFLFAERVEAQEEIIEEVTEKILPPPPPPISPLKYIKDQKGKNTTYFYEKRELNYSEAIKLVEGKKDINIESKKINDKTIINFSEEPITIYEQKPKKRKSSKQSITSSKNIKLNLSLTKKDTIKKPIKIKYEKLSASKSEMKEYNSIIERGKKDRLFKNKDIIKLQYLYSSMSKEQKNSVEDYASIIPPPPPPIMVKKGEKSNIPPPPAPKVKKGEESNIPPPPPPVKTKDGVEKGWFYANNQTLYYVKEKGETKYFNRWGNAVDKEGKLKTNDNVVYYLNGERISKKEINKIDKDKIETINVYRGKNDKKSIHLTMKEKTNKDFILYKSGKANKKSEFNDNDSKELKYRKQIIKVAERKSSEFLFKINSKKVTSSQLYSYVNKNPESIIKVSENSDGKLTLDFSTSNNKKMNEDELQNVYSKVFNLVK